MVKKISDAGHIYLYAVIPGEKETDLGIKGLFDSDVHIFCEKGICAAVSEIPVVDKLRPERKHLSAHQSVLSYLVDNDNVVLPVSFGTVADNAKGIREMLSKYHKAFRDQIDKVSGKVEMELRVVYDVPNVFEYFVSKYPDLKEERDQLYNTNGEPSREQKIELGQHFEQVQNEDRQKLTERMESKLRSACDEVKQNRPRNEKEVMRVSCLIDRDRIEKFQSALEEASDQFNDSTVIEYNGPLPPYNFVEVRVHI